MEPLISIAILTFKKTLEKGTKSRYILQAEFNSEKNTFTLTKTVFVHRRSKVLAHSTRHQPCTGIIDAMQQLALAAENAGLEGFSFDVSGLSMVSPEEDEDWVGGLLPDKKSRPSAKLRSKH